MKPLALLLEDNLEVSVERAEELRREGLSVLTASNIDEAYNHLYSSPSLDILICDINLNVDDPLDKSGYEFAENTRSRFKDVEIIGYSGHFDARSFKKTAKAKNIFSEIFPRGRDDDFMGYVIGRVQEISKKFDLSTEDKEFKELIELIRDNVLTDPTMIQAISDFASQLKRITQDNIELTKDFDLAQSGYKLVFFSADNFKNIMNDDTSSLKVNSELPVWCRYENSNWKMEVFGHHKFQTCAQNRNEGYKSIVAKMTEALCDASDSQSPKFDESHVKFAENFLGH